MEAAMGAKAIASSRTPTSFLGLAVSNSRQSHAQSFKIPEPVRRAESRTGQALCLKRDEDVVRHLATFIFGRGLPPTQLVEAARLLWGSGWQVLMGRLAPQGENKSFDRPKSQFRGRPDPSKCAVRGNFHLYVAVTCPWAHRALIVHSLKGLGDAVPLSVVVPGAGGLWEFSSGPEPRGGKFVATKDRANGERTLLEVYRRRREGYNGRATVPMLWDQSASDVVNNESADIVEILNSEFNDVAERPDLDLAPPSLKSQITHWDTLIYPNVNNGVYRCGFAQGQEAYNEAAENLFKTLMMLEEHLATSRYLCGETLTLADIKLFTTLYRFDPVYSVLFKCTAKKLAEFPNLYNYLRDIYQVPGVDATCDLSAIMDGYYGTLFPLNPGGIRPVVPVSAEAGSLLQPHGRESLSKVTVGTTS